MGEIKSLEQLTLVTAFVVPGLVALFTRAQFLHGRVGVTKDSILTFVCLTLVWYGLSAPFVTWLAANGPPLPWQSGGWFLWTIVGPAIFGALLGLNASLGWTRKVLDRCGIRTVHAQPSAWDWKFHGMRSPEFVLVVLKDGTSFAGFCGTKSFISSDPRERDIYLERIYRIAEDGSWQDQGERGLLVLHGELRSIEFVPQPT